MTPDPIGQRSPATAETDTEAPSPPGDTHKKRPVDTAIAGSDENKKAKTESE